MSHKLFCGGKNFDPEFGKGELTACQPYNGEKKCYSFVNSDGFRIPMNSDRRSMLTNLICENKFG